VPSQEVYDRVFVPWAKAARNLPALAEWLTRHHMSRAIDDYSIQATEQVLADTGYVPERPTVLPAVAFLDLTGFTSLTQERGDTIAAEMALRLAELASRAVATHRGRVVKLLGDGVLMHFPDIVEAVDAALDLMDLLAASDLPPGHVGITQGPIVARDGDIFGRTVNLASRISDVTPSGELYIPASISHGLAGRFVGRGSRPRAGARGCSRSRRRMAGGAAIRGRSTTRTRSTSSSCYAGLVSTLRASRRGERSVSSASTSRGASPNSRRRGPTTGSSRARSSRASTATSSPPARTSAWT
jgi:class 3 adenylate cyclase